MQCINSARRQQTDAFISHNVAKLRQFHGALARAKGVQRVSIAAAINLNVEIADLLAERVAVEPQKIGRADLISPGRR